MPGGGLPEMGDPACEAPSGGDPAIMDWLCIILLILYVRISEDFSVGDQTHFGCVLFFGGKGIEKFHL